MMKTETNKYFLTNELAVDQFAAIKIADLNYKDDSDRNDDLGALYVAPVIQAGWDAPLGLLAIYASTNGDPIWLGQIEDGEVEWDNSVTDDDQGMLDVLNRAEWIHPKSGEGYSYIVMDAVPSND